MGYSSYHVAAAWNAAVERVLAKVNGGWKALIYLIRRNVGFQKNRISLRQFIEGIRRGNSKLAGSVPCGADQATPSLLPGNGGF